MHTRTAAFRDVNAQAFWRIFSVLRKQTLELPNSVVRDINHFQKDDFGVSKSKMAGTARCAVPWHPNSNLETNPNNC
jgi:hypothetical protein